MGFSSVALPVSVDAVIDLQKPKARTKDGSIVSTSGYYSPGDGGGDVFVYHRTGRSGITTSTFRVAGSGVDDYFEAVDRSRVNLRRAGCIGNGIADELVAFTNAVTLALAESVPLFVPQGAYNLSSLSSAISITADFTMVGEGHASRIIGDNIDQVLFSVAATAAANIICENLYFSTWQSVFMFLTNTSQPTHKDIRLVRNTCDNFGGGICNMAPGNQLNAESIDISYNTLTNMGLSLISVRPRAIDISYSVCPKITMIGNRIDGCGSLDVKDQVIAILADATGATDTAQSVVISDNIVKNVLSSAREGTEQICGIMALECHPTITGNVIDNVAGMPPSTFTVDPGTDIFTSNTHRLNDTNWIRFYGDDLPLPLVEGVVYYVVNATANTFQVEAAISGGAIDITDAGSGTLEWFAPHPSSPEAIYTKSSKAVVSNNTIIDVLGTEGVINMKGESSGPASAEKSVISGNSIAFRTIQTKGNSTSINCSAPSISCIGNVIEGTHRGVVSIYDDTVISNNILRGVQTVGIEFVSGGTDYTLLIKDNIFANIGQGVGTTAYGIILTNGDGASFSLVEITNNTFIDFNADNHYGCLMLNISSTTPISRTVINNNRFVNINTPVLLNTVDGSQRFDYIEFSFNSMYNSDIDFILNATTRSIKYLLNTKNGKLWLDNHSPTLFDPTTISGLVSWWNTSVRANVIFSVATGQLAVDGDIVERILDSSGNGNHLNYNGVAPLLHNAVTSGLPTQSVYFRGLGDDMQCTLPASCGADCTMFMVQKVGGIKRFTADASTDYITSTLHGVVNDTVLRFYGSDLPAPLAESTDYYVINRTNDTFQVSATLAGAAIDITDAGSGLMRFAFADQLFLWWYQHSAWGAADERWLWIAANGDATADGIGYLSGTPTYRKNGATVTFTTRDNVFDETSEILCIITAESIDFSGWDYDADQFHVGGELFGTFYVTGHFLECLLYNRALTTTERTLVEAYLAEAYEITLP